MNPLDPYNIRQKLVNAKAKLNEAKGQVFHFRGFHVYCNYDFSNRDNPDPMFAANGAMWYDRNRAIIRENHRVHLFYRRLPICVEDGGLRSFIIKAAKITKKKVIIHVPKSDKHTHIAMLMAVANITGACQVIAEKNSHVSIFRYMNYGIHEFLCVGWAAPGDKIFTELATPRKESV